MYLGISIYLHYIAAVQTRLDRSEQLIVDTCILGMQAELSVHLECEIHHRGTLRQHYRFALRCKGHNVVVIERTHHFLDKTCTLLTACSNVAQH